MKNKLKILDLCSGLGGFSEAFLKRGHQVIRIDIDKRFKDVPHTIIGDVFKIASIQPAEYIRGFGLKKGTKLKDIIYNDVDVILASPPCQAFSVASISHHWTGGKGAYIPKTQFAGLSMELVKKISSIVKSASAIYFIENPRCVLRKLGILDNHPRHTITYCQYGENRMKPTDIWTNSKEWEPRSMCKNGDPCHERAPRGAKTGTQGLKNSALRALIPYELSLEICIACEEELDNI